MGAALVQARAMNEARCPVRGEFAGSAGTNASVSVLVLRWPFSTPGCSVLVGSDAIDDSKGSFQELAQIRFRVFPYPSSAPRQAGELLGAAQEPSDNCIGALG